MPAHTYRVPSIEFHPELRRSARLVPKQMITPVTLPFVRAATRMMWRHPPKGVEVLTLAPGHTAGQHGLERITVRYAELAEAAFRRQQHLQSREFLERGLAINPAISLERSIRLSTSMCSFKV